MKFWIFNRKRGWIKIIEAFVGILIITGVILIILNKGYIEKEDQSPNIYAFESTILSDFQQNDSIREEILSLPVPLEWKDGAFPQSISGKIQNSEPVYLDCRAKICSIEDICIDNSFGEGNIYAKSVIISSNSTTYNPRQLKIFCLEI